MSNETQEVRTELAAISVPVLTPAHLKTQLRVENERRQLLQRFIQHNLTEGVDYGRIHVMPKDKCPQPWQCKNERHLSKPCLFKPGAEKFCSLLQLRAEFNADQETLRMIGDDRTGTVAFRCQLTHIPTDKLIAEGRGTCALSEKGGMANTTVKIAEKRAHIDAVLRLGLSDSFTQDLEEMKGLTEAMVDATPKPEQARITAQQLQDMRFYAFVKRASMESIRAYAQKHFKAPLEEVTYEQGTKIMRMLEKKYGKLEDVVAATADDAQENRA